MSKSPIYFPSLSSDISKYKTKKNLISNLDYSFFTDSYGNHKYPYFLITAGSEYKKENIREKCGLNDSLVFGDSGGYQIATGVITYSDEIREKIFHWLENNSDIAMQLDFPPAFLPSNKFQECLDKTILNIRYFSEKQTGKTDFINVMQTSSNLEKTEHWFNSVKDFEFNGWGIGGTKRTKELIYTFVLMLKNREFEKANCKLIHILGNTKVSDFFLYGVLQNNFNKKFPHVQVTTDSASPSLGALFGSYYHSMNLRTLGLNLINFPGQKNNFPYDVDKSLPCTWDCPVCNNLTYKNISDEKYGKVKDYMTYHNLYALIGVKNYIWKLCDGNFELLKSAVPFLFYQVLESINKLFDADLNEVEKIFQSYIPIYNKFDAMIEKNESNNSFDEGLEEIFG